MIEFLHLRRNNLWQSWMFRGNPVRSLQTIHGGTRNVGSINVSRTGVDDSGTIRWCAPGLLGLISIAALLR
jgi:hypothetical protein